MRWVFHPVCQGAGLAQLCLIVSIYPLIEPSHNFIYHLDGSPAVFFVPILLDLAFLCAVFAGLLVFAERQRGRLGLAVLAALLLLPPLTLIKAVYLGNGWPKPHWVKVMELGAALAAWGCITVMVDPRSVRGGQVRRLAAAVFGFAGLSAIAVVLQLCFCFFEARNLQRAPPLHSRISASAGSVAIPERSEGRVIWIVLDELSYQQVYERRFPGLALPAFDRLAAESAVFTHVVPAGIRTDVVLPSLISGIHADSIRTSADGLTLALHQVETGRWVRFGPAQTIFEDALSMHYSTAVAGWYVPYCRILPQVLDACTWSWSATRDGGMEAHSSILRNAVDNLMLLMNGAPLIQELRFRRPRSRDAGANQLDEMNDHADYEALTAAADGDLSNAANTMVLIHLPVPHPGSFYSRRSGAFITHGGSYVDGLALADKYVGHVRELLQQRGEWDRDTILIMGDHSWRTRLVWRASNGWTAEDEKASFGGTFDDRPAYILKLPGEVAGAQVDSPMEAMRTRALLDALLEHRIANVAQLRAWVGGPTP